MTLKQLANERGIAIERLVVDAIEEHGSVYQAAAALKVYPNTLSNFLSLNGLRVERHTIARVVPITDPKPDSRLGAEQGGD